MSSGKKKSNNSKIAIWVLVKMVAEDIRFIIPWNSYTDVLKDTWHKRWIKMLVRSSDIPKKSVSSIPGEGSGELPVRKLTGDNW